MTPSQTLTQARERLVAGEFTPVELVADHLEIRNASEPVVRAWTHVDPDRALADAAGLNASQRGELPLWGIPIGIKDIIDVAGMPTTAASRVLAGNMAMADAPVVARLRAAGAIVLGKTNTQEFAYGAVTPGTTNPWDPSRIAGGSSGGSAAALAAGHCLGALGTDTAGSIRIPAALCGMVGLKPRPGIVSLEGVIPLAPSFDALGPMGLTVADVALLWEVVSGQQVDLGDGSDLKVVFAPLAALPELEPEVATAYAAAVEVLRGTAAGVREADVSPFASFDVPRSTVLTWEALQVHRSRGWWPARVGDYTEETRGYLSRAEKNLTPEAVEEARAQCRKLAAQLISALDGADVLATPTVPCVAPTHEEAAARNEDSPRRPVVMKLTRIPGPVNVAALAALSVPCGSGAGGLPIGLQLIGRDEGTVLRMGAAYGKRKSFDGAIHNP